jgi:lysophospholipase L1-like esterase
MKRVLCSLLLMIAGCRPGSSPSAASPPPHPSGQRFLALGDSYTIGESVAASERWPVQLARMLRDQGLDVADPQVVATTGWTTDELSAGMDEARPAGPYRLVTLLIGVNNQFRGRGLEEFRTQFRGLLARAIALAGDKPSRVVVVSIPDYGVTPFGASRDPARIGRQIDAFNAVCRAEAGRAGAAFVDITPGSRDAAADPSLVAPDGLHPSGKMYRRWAEQALPAARRALEN